MPDEDTALVSVVSRPAVVALLLMVAALVTPGSAAAVSWWVAADTDAAPLREALDTYWPGHDINVRVGAPTYQREGIWYAGGELVLVVGERVRWQTIEPGWPAQVALVRSWLRDRDKPGPGWIPKAKQEVAGYGIVAAGAGLRLPTVGPDLRLGPASPNGHLAIEGGVAWPYIRVGVATAVDFGESAGSGNYAVAISRLWVGGMVALTAPLGPIEMENHLGIGGRLVIVRPKELLTEDPTTVRLPTFALGLRLMGRASPTRRRPSP